MFLFIVSAFNRSVSPWVDQITFGTQTGNKVFVLFSSCLLLFSSFRTRNQKGLLLLHEPNKFCINSRLLAHWKIEKLESESEYKASERYQIGNKNGRFSSTGLIISRKKKKTMNTVYWWLFPIASGLLWLRCIVKTVNYNCSFNTEYRRPSMQCYFINIFFNSWDMSWKIKGSSNFSLFFNAAMKKSAYSSQSTSTKKRNLRAYNKLLFNLWRFIRRENWMLS